MSAYLQCEEGENHKAEYRKRHDFGELLHGVQQRVDDRLQTCKCKKSHLRPTNEVSQARDGATRGSFVLPAWEGNVLNSACLEWAVR